MIARKTTLAVFGLAMAWAGAAEAQQAWSFRLGNDPYKYVDDAPPRAYTRMPQTPSAYFRTPTNLDDQVGGAPPPDEVTRLADELGHHLKMNYKHDIPEYNRRYVHFRAAMDEWDKSPKGIPEQVQMTSFLKTSIKYSMPGSHDFLPPLPQVNPIDQLNESSYARGVEDPFKDDPVQAAPM
ncbi:MAG: hypothetical protein AB7G28_17670 [Pirellulales bacterium]